MNRVRLVAEHEAAHAIAAAALGVHVDGITIDARGNGATLHHGAPDTHTAAVITAAGDVWNRHLGTVPYEDLACDDLARFEREHGLSRLWSANHEAQQILRQHRRLVLDLASRLVTARSIRFPAAPHLI
ncbi:M50 family metallopeptidase [Streptomyces sp. CC210A]|uniref:M50 family metallopeptidase n=1 Tax=Streptomyces sp. CC210A TaxID=2898184 RepID=UPI001F277D4D|nr:M50 family metallopeptidase [Streptomyces sp. CC210A]